MARSSYAPRFRVPALARNLAVLGRAIRGRRKHTHLALPPQRFKQQNLTF